MEMEKGKESFQLSLSFLLPPADLTNDSCIIIISHVFGNVLCLDCQLSWWSTPNGVIQEHKLPMWSIHVFIENIFCRFFASEIPTAGNHKYTNSIKLFLNAEVPFCMYHFKCSRKHNCYTDIQIISPVF